MWSWWEISYVRYVSFHNVSNYWTSTTNKLTATTGSIDQLALCLVFDSVIYCVPFVSHPVTLLLFRGFCCLFIPSPCLTIPGWFIPSPCLTIPGWSFCPFTHLFCCFQAQIFHRISLNNLIIAITATTHANIPPSVSRLSALLATRLVRFIPHLFITLLTSVQCCNTPCLAINSTFYGPSITFLLGYINTQYENRK